MTGRRVAALWFAALLVASMQMSITSAFALGTEGPPCPAYEGVVCDGWVTDAAGVTSDDARLEETVARVVAAHGHQIAIVIVADSGSRSPRSFAGASATPGESVTSSRTTES